MFITTESALQYEEIKRMGGAIIKPGQVIRLNYKVSLSLEDLITNNKFIDNSEDHEDVITVKYGSGSLLKGVEEGLKGMEKGATRHLIVPPHLAFGQRGVPGIIPANAVLYIEVNISTKT